MQIIYNIKKVSNLLVLKIETKELRAAGKSASAKRYFDFCLYKSVTIRQGI